jgi:DNA-binding NtrC family response regulator
MVIQLRVEGPRLGTAAFATARDLEPGCEVAASRGVFPSGRQAQGRLRNTAPGVGYPARSAPRSSAKPPESERHQVRAARKVADAEHIATAKRMKADGHTAKDIAKFLGVSRATLYRYLAPDLAA